jgi:NADPH2:quinone reductase
MKAILMTAPGAPTVLQIADVPTPEIQTQTGILVRLKAAGVNPIDTKLRQRGTFYPDQMPAILGCDGAGIVEAVGAAVTRFQPGDEVYFCDGGLGAATGNYGKFTVVEEHCVALKPQSLSFIEAAAVPLALITAWESLFDRGRLEEGRTVLIHGGAGGVGHLAVQLAKLKGAWVATTVSSPAKGAFVTELGADLGILYRETDFVTAALDWTEGEGVDLAFDTVGGKIFEATFPAVQIYGDLVTILQPDNTVNWKIARERNLRISLEIMLTPMLKKLTFAQKHQAQMLRESARLFDEGKLKVYVSQVLPLEEAAQAHQLIETGSTMGKLVLAID